MPTKVSGVMIAPGVSRNSRLYTKEAIRKGVARLTERLASSDEPVVMKTHHKTDNSTHIVGRVLSVNMSEDGAVRFDAEMADTQAARDVVVLARGKQPFLKGVSIRGRWMSPPRQEKLSDGRMVETADDLEFDGLDWTSSPGVKAARVTSVGATTDESFDEGFCEDVSATITEDGGVEEQKVAPYGDVEYADPGFRGGIKRYPVDTKARALAAWGYIHQAANKARYKPTQVAHIMAAIKAALTKFGVHNVESTESDLLESAFDQLEEADRKGSVRVDLSNPDVRISISTTDQWDHGGVAADKVAAVHEVFSRAAAAALKVIDPDADGDIDFPDGTDTKDESMTNGPLSEQSLAAVVEAVRTALAPAADAGTAVAPVVPAPVVESTPPDATAVNEAVDRMVTEMRDKFRAKALEAYGLPDRKGLVAESDAPEPAPLHELDDEQFAAEKAALADAMLGR